MASLAYHTHHFAAQSGAGYVANSSASGAGPPPCPQPWCHTITLSPSHTHTYTHRSGCTPACTHTHTCHCPQALQGVWAPYYMVHKVLAGLLDAHTLAQHPLALPMATAMADYFHACTAKVGRGTERGHWVGRLVQGMGRSYPVPAGVCCGQAHKAGCGSWGGTACVRACTWSCGCGCCYTHELLGASFVT